MATVGEALFTFWILTIPTCYLGKYIFLSPFNLVTFLLFILFGPTTSATETEPHYRPWETPPHLSLPSQGLALM